MFLKQSQKMQKNKIGCMHKIGQPRIFLNNLTYVTLSRSDILV